MYKVLIVDDEPAIREGLRTLIEWRRFGFEICGEAGGGKEGLRLCGELLPDLVLADIRMPGMDGIGMMEAARRQGLSCRFMVLTGYSEFHYAKKAIDQGVECYLLKPIDPGELESHVECLCQELSKEHAIREQADEGVRRQTERLVQKLLSHDDLAERQSAYDGLAGRLGFPWPSCRVLLIETETDKKHALDAPLWEAREVLRREIESRGYGYVCIMDGYTIVLLNETLAVSVKPLLETLCRDFKERHGLRIWVFPGNTVHDASQLPLSFESAMNVARQAFLHRSEEQCWIERADQPAGAGEEEPESVLDEEYYAVRLAMAVDSGNPEALRKEAGDAIRLIVRTNGIEQSIKMRTAMLYMSVLHRLQSAAHEAGERLLPFRTAPAEWNECRSLTALSAAFGRRLLQLSDAVNRDRPAAALHRMLDFIRRHYDQDLKLETLAEMFHYNSSYLGKLFRQQTGEYFNTYLDRVRIENAIGLLKQGLKVHQVASRVGYCDVDYFHRKFKKYVGVAPSAFRERHDL